MVFRPISFVLSFLICPANRLIEAGSLDEGRFMADAAFGLMHEND